MDKLNITVTPQELMIIGEGLSNLPYNKVASLLSNLQDQFNAAQPSKVLKDADEPSA